MMAAWENLLSINDKIMNIEAFLFWLTFNCNQKTLKQAVENKILLIILVYYYKVSSVKFYCGTVEKFYKIANVSAELTS